jgi:O-antigen ligase
MDQRFQEVLGPKGFYLHDFESTSVDVFWLHLLVEVGALGLIAYLAWMYLISAPLIKAAWRRGTERRDAIFLWSTGAVVFAVLIATWSASLEDPLFPPMLFGVLGFGWVLLCSTPSSAASAAVADGDEDNVRPERRR